MTGTCMSFLITVNCGDSLSPSRRPQLPLTSIVCLTLVVILLFQSHDSPLTTKKLHSLQGYNTCWRRWQSLWIDNIPICCGKQCALCVRTACRSVFCDLKWIKVFLILTSSLVWPFWKCFSLVNIRVATRAPSQSRCDDGIIPSQDVIQQELVASTATNWWVDWL